MRTPWGESQTVTRLAEGITSVTTASHGGIKLAAQLNAMIPEGMRASDGWYEEDCAWAVVAIHFPLAFEARLQPHAWEVARRYYPVVASALEAIHGVYHAPRVAERLAAT